MTAVFPRFLGVDGNGDFVWELVTGRWTWGDTPYDAATRQRTFTPDRYVEKYGEPQITAPFLGRPDGPVPFPGPSEPEPQETILGDIMAARTNGKALGASAALAAMERAAKGWADGAAENEEAMGRRDRKPSDEQPFVLADILNMIDDAAREVGVAPVYSERSKRP